MSIEDIVDRLRQRAESSTESPMMSAVRDTLEWEAADEIIYLRHDLSRLKTHHKEIRNDLIEALEECLREHGGFTIRGLCEQRARAAIAKARENQP